MKLKDLFNNTNYDDTLFSDESKISIESAIITKRIKEKDAPYIKCLACEKEIRFTPEEAVRQLYLYKLIHEFNYPTSRIEVEFPIHFGREVKRADIAIMDKYYCPVGFLQILNFKQVQRRTSIRATAQ